MELLQNFLVMESSHFGNEWGSVLCIALQLRQCSGFQGTGGRGLTCHPLARQVLEGLGWGAGGCPPSALQCVQPRLSAPNGTNCFVSARFCPPNGFTNDQQRVGQPCFVPSFQPPAPSSAYLPRQNPSQTLGNGALVGGRWAMWLWAPTAAESLTRTSVLPTPPPPPNRFVPPICWVPEPRRFVLLICGGSVILPLRSADFLGLLGFYDT